MQNHSVEGLQFLEGLGLNLSTIVRLGGHTYPRTHSNPVGEGDAGVESRRRSAMCICVYVCMYVCSHSSPSASRHKVYIAEAVRGGSNSFAVVWLLLMSLMHAYVHVALSAVRSQCWLRTCQGCVKQGAGSSQCRGHHECKGVCLRLWGSWVAGEGTATLFED